MAPQQESYRVATNNASAAKPKKGKKQKAADLDDLKKEVEMDEHKIAPEELFTRLGTDINRVSSTKKKTKKTGPFLERLRVDKQLRFRPNQASKPSYFIGNI
jgi:hypothetical protein